MYKKPIYTFLLVVAATVILLILYITFLNLVFENLSERALFGDSFGGLNAFVSSLAFGGIIYTILLQRRDLKTQRAEINYQRKEFQINRITNIIYHEIQKYNASLEDINLIIDSTEPMTYVGEAGFRELSEKLKTFMNFGNITTVDEASTYVIKDKTLFTKEVKRQISANKEALNYIFNQLYNSVRIINLTLKDENIDTEDKEELKAIFILNLGTTMNEIIKMFDLVISEIAKDDLDFIILDQKIEYLKTFQGNRDQYNANTYKK